MSSIISDLIAIDAIHKNLANDGSLQDMLNFIDSHAPNADPAAGRPGPANQDQTDDVYIEWTQIQDEQDERLAMEYYDNAEFDRLHCPEPMPSIEEIQSYCSVDSQRVVCCVHLLQWSRRKSFVFVAFLLASAAGSAM